MAEIPIWQPATFYLPNAVVRPTTIVPPLVIPGNSIANPDFELGDQDWTYQLAPEFTIVQEISFSGTWAAKWSGMTFATFASTVSSAVTPGQTVSMTCMAYLSGVDTQVRARLLWFDSIDDFVTSNAGPATGNAFSGAPLGSWIQLSLEAVVPAGVSFVRVGCNGSNSVASEFAYFDNFAWNLATADQPGNSEFTFKAVQAEAGLSGAVEPVWPTVLSNTVVDNEVTWEAVLENTVTWQASPLLTSGGSEPTWPTTPGVFVADNDIAWETIALRITDVNCPNTKVVAIAASKVFAGDEDIVRFSATLNPRDWTSQEDAGFLPTGLQQKGQIGVDAMGVYRGNLAVWSPSTFQLWQVDPDPAAMALLDAMEGIGSTYQQAVQPIANELFFLAALGVRTVSIAEGSNNMSAGDAGVPIDPLIQAEVDGTVEPLALYYPSQGQYWIAFRALFAPLLVAGTFLLTSHIYPIEITEGIQSEFGIERGRRITSGVEAVKSGMSIVSGDLINRFNSYDDAAPEAVISDMDIVSGVLTARLVVYDDAAPEAVISAMAVVSGVLTDRLITYQDADPEAVISAMDIVSGTLT